MLRFRTNVISEDKGAVLKSIIITLALLACGCSLAPSVVAQESGVEVGVAVDDAAAKLGAQILERDKRKLAVVSFSDINGFESALGDFLAEEATGRQDSATRDAQAKVLEQVGDWMTR